MLTFYSAINETVVVRRKPFSGFVDQKAAYEEQRKNPTV